jgi:hypothetical protein
MSDDSPIATVVEGEDDHWPSFDITPKAYEEAVAAIAKSMNLDLVGWEVKHLDPIEGLDRTYIMDVTARFQLAGMDFLIPFECKRHKDPSNGPMSRCSSPSSSPRAPKRASWWPPPDSRAVPSNSPRPTASLASAWSTTRGRTSRATPQPPPRPPSPARTPATR